MTHAAALAADEQRTRDRLRAAPAVRQGRLGGGSRSAVGQRAAEAADQRKQRRVDAVAGAATADDRARAALVRQYRFPACGKKLAEALAGTVTITCSKCKQMHPLIRSAR